MAILHQSITTRHPYSSDPFVHRLRDYVFTTLRFPFQPPKWTPLPSNLDGPAALYAEVPQSQVTIADCRVGIAVAFGGCHHQN